MPSYYSLLLILSSNFYLKESTSINLSAPVTHPNFHSLLYYGVKTKYNVSRLALIGALARFFQGIFKLSVPNLLYLTMKGKSNLTKAFDLNLKFSILASPLQSPTFNDC